jgi:hypothetical protein
MDARTQTHTGTGRRPATAETRLAAWADERNAADPGATHLVKHYGARDISFTGWKVGEGTCVATNADEKKPWETGFAVAIYITDSGRIVLSVVRWSTHESVGAVHSAAILQSAQCALDFLTGTGALGMAARTAWRTACMRCPPLSEAEPSYAS